MQDIASTDTRNTMRTTVETLSLKGSLLSSKDASELPVVLVDISETGFGVWSPSQIAKGERINFEPLGQGKMSLECEVIWCRPSEDMGFRVGLRILNDSRNQAYEAVTNRLLDFAFCC